MTIRTNSLEIRPVRKDDLEAVLEVYQQREDFLALGPLATASVQMLLKDIQASRREGGIFCGIWNAAGELVGLVDYIPGNYAGNLQTAYLSLLVIAAPHRNQGIGKLVLEAVEQQVRKGTLVTEMLLGVQTNNSRALQFWQRNGYRIIGGPRTLPDQTIYFEMRKDFDPEEK
jgi:ribosomal protein S18 acetylase RimI-like enzyme